MQQKEWRFGKHLVRFEPPDVVWMQLSGPVSQEEVMQWVEIYREVGTVQPFFMVVDMSDCLIDPKGREYMAKLLKQEWFHGMIFVGMGMVQRAIAKALAVSLFFANWRVDIDFMPNEQEARALIAKKRVKLGIKAA